MEYLNPVELLTGLVVLVLLYGLLQMDQFGAVLRALRNRQSLGNQATHDVPGSPTEPYQAGCDETPNLFRR